VSTICQFWATRRKIWLGVGAVARQRRAQDEEERNDQAADQERNAPAPLHEILGRQDLAQDDAEDGDQNDRDLLAAGLPADIEALVAGRGDFRKINRNAAKLDAGGETLDQPAEHDDDRRQHAERRITRNQRDRDRADRHQRQRQHQPGAAAVMVDIGAEEDAAEWPHQEAGAEGHEGQHQLGELAAVWKKRLADRAGVIAEDEKVVHFQEVTAGNANHRPDLFAALFRAERRHNRFLPTLRSLTGRRGIHCLRQC
jgi:hypothetical protein